MYNTLTGKYPIIGPTSAETMSRHITDPPLDFCESSPEIAIPFKLQRTIMKTLKKHPQDRPQTMRELLIELENFRD